MGNNIMVSVFMMAYNHEKYVAQALDSVLIQKVDFEYQIVLGEDCSTDNTREIVIKYAELYPKKFKLLLHKTNIGAVNNQNLILANCTGKYIAMLECDDYWTDPNKLQTQFDIMETNGEYSFTFHSVSVKNEIKSINYNYPKPSKKILTFKDILKKHYIPTCSVFFRSEMFPKPDPDFLINCLMGDLPVQ